MRHWYSRNPLALALWPLSQLFGLTVTLRRRAYLLGWLRRHPIPVPVIVIGNITVGGTGKTPLVIALVKLLRRNGYRPGVVSRGYGSRAGPRPLLVTANADPVDAGDEPVLIAQRCGCPVVIDRDRPRGALELVRQGCDVVLADDGLQHYALDRDIEIAVIDGRRRFGNGFLLPAGPLREGRSRLQQVDLVVTNGQARGGEYALRLRLGLAVNLLDSGCTRDLSQWQGCRVRALAGIGDPERFFADLSACGLRVDGRALPDHYHFRPADLAHAGDRPLLMTEKDAVKCRVWARAEHWYVPVEAELSEGFIHEVLRRLASLAAAMPRPVESVVR